MTFALLLASPGESIPLQAYLALAAVLFCTGVWGLINSRNAVRVLMSIELMLNAVNLNLMAFSNYLDGQLIRGQVFAIFVSSSAQRLACRWAAWLPARTISQTRWRCMARDRRPLQTGYQRSRLKRSMSTVSRFLYRDSRIARPTAASAAATVITKMANTWPRINWPSR